MKINIFIPSILQGGGLKVIFGYANYFVDKGHDVLIYIPMIFEGLENKCVLRTSIANTFIRGKTIKWYDCKFKTKKILKISNNFVRNADISIATAASTAYRVSKLNKKKGEKVYFIQGHETNADNSDLELVDRTYKYDMHRIVITNYMHNYLENNYKLSSKIIFNGIAENEFYYGEKKLNERKTIIMLGNIAHYKGGYNGINILNNLSKVNNLRVIIFGLNEIANLPKHFEFYQKPDRDLLMNLYRESDICLFPSIEEGWGLVVTEAMANKCAVVGNNTGVLRDICTNNENALISYSFESKELETMVQKLLDDESKLRYIQNNGFELAKELLFSKQCQKFEDVLISLIKDGEGKCSN